MMTLLCILLEAEGKEWVGTACGKGTQQYRFACMTTELGCFCTHVIGIRGLHCAVPTWLGTCSCHGLSDINMCWLLHTGMRSLGLAAHRVLHAILAVRGAAPGQQLPSTRQRHGLYMATSHDMYVTYMPPCACRSACRGRSALLLHNRPPPTPRPDLWSAAAGYA